MDLKLVILTSVNDTRIQPCTASQWVQREVEMG